MAGITATKYERNGASWFAVSTYMGKITFKNNDTKSRLLKGFTMPLAKSGYTGSIYGGSGAVTVSTSNWSAYLSSDAQGSSKLSSEVTISSSVSLASAGTSTSNQGYFNQPTALATLTLSSPITLAAGATKVIYLRAKVSNGAVAIQKRASLSTVPSEYGITVMESEIPTIKSPSVTISPNVTTFSVGESITVTAKSQDSYPLAYLHTNYYYSGSPHMGTLSSDSLSATLKDTVVDSYRSSSLQYFEKFEAQALKSYSGGTKSTTNTYTRLYQPRDMKSNQFTYSIKIGGQDVVNNSNITITPSDNLVEFNWSTFPLTKHKGNFNYYILKLVESSSGTTKTIKSGSNTPSSKFSGSVQVTSLSVGKYKLVLECTYKTNNGTVLATQSSAKFTSQEFTVGESLRAVTVIAPSITNSYSSRTTPIIIFELNSDVKDISINVKGTGTNNYSYSTSPEHFNLTNSLKSGSFITFRSPTYLSRVDKLEVTIKVTNDYSSLTSPIYTINYYRVEFPVQNTMIMKSTRDVLNTSMLNAKNYYSNIIGDSYSTSTKDIIDGQEWINRLNWFKNLFNILKAEYNYTLYPSDFYYDNIKLDKDTKIVMTEDRDSKGNFIYLLYYIMMDVI